MAALLITSSKDGVGKTTLAVGLGRNLIQTGKKVGYLKQSVNSAESDTDGAFMRDALGLKESLPLISHELTDPAQLMEAYRQAAAGRDVVIIEAGQDEGAGLAEALGASVIVIESYPAEFEPEELKVFGKRLLGVVYNRVPRSQLKKAQEASLEVTGAGITVLGILPEERILGALSIGELVNAVQGQILHGDKPPEELVENVMLGAMTLDPGPDYFARKSNKAVVLRSERPDMQMAALETSTRVLVLSGETAPAGLVLRKAKARKVPIVLTRDDIQTAVGKLETALAGGRLNQTGKLPRLAELMKQCFNFSQVYQGLGLK